MPFGELPQRPRTIILGAMAKKGPASVRIVKRVPVNRAGAVNEPPSPPAGRPSSLLDTRVIYCGDCLEQLRKLPEKCIDLIYIDPPFNSNRNYEVFWGETKAKRAFEDRHASTAAYIDYMRPRCVELARGRRRITTPNGTAQTMIR